jgi:hypothetical protein
MNIFFEGPKTQNSTFLMRADGFHNFLLYFCEENANEIFISFECPQRFPKLVHVPCLKGLGLENRFKKFDKNGQLWASETRQVIKFFRGSSVLI